MLHPGKISLEPCDVINRTPHDEPYQSEGEWWMLVEGQHYSLFVNTIEYGIACTNCRCCSRVLGRENGEFAEELADTRPNPYLGKIDLSLGDEVRAITPIAFAEHNSTLRVLFHR